MGMQPERSWERKKAPEHMEVVVLVAVLRPSRWVSIDQQTLLDDTSEIEQSTEYRHLDPCLGFCHI